MLIIFQIESYKDFLLALLTDRFFQTLGGCKVLPNEKGGRFKVVSLDRSPFKLLTIRFSNKLVQAPSCDRHKTTQRSLFLTYLKTKIVCKHYINGSGTFLT
jgi:hypothetical protein